MLGPDSHCLVLNLRCRLPLLRTCAFWMVSVFHIDPIHLNLPRDETRLIAPLRRVLNVLYTCESMSKSTNFPILEIKCAAVPSRDI